MFDSIQPQPWPSKGMIEDLKVIGETDWKRNAFDISLRMILFTQRLSIYQQSPIPTIPDFLRRQIIAAVVFAGPIFTDDVVSAWRAAGEKSAVASMRTADFVKYLGGLPAVYFRAMRATWKATLGLYARALSETARVIYRALFG